MPTPEPLVLAAARCLREGQPFTPVICHALAALPVPDRVRLAELLESLAPRTPVGLEPGGGSPHGG